MRDTVTIRPSKDFWPFVLSIEIRYVSGGERYLFQKESQLETMTAPNVKNENTTWSLKSHADGMWVRLGSYDFAKGGLQSTTCYGFIAFVIGKIVTKSGVCLKTPEDVVGFFQ